MPGTEAEHGNLIPVSPFPPLCLDSAVNDVRLEMCWQKCWDFG